MDAVNYVKVVFVAQSKYLHYAKMFICKYVIESGAVPLNSFNALGYRMHGMVDRASVLICDYNYIRICEELWCFGKISNGVLQEIRAAIHFKKPISYFDEGAGSDGFRSKKIDELEFESEDFTEQKILEIKRELQSYVMETIENE